MLNEWPFFAWQPEKEENGENMKIKGLNLNSFVGALFLSVVQCEVINNLYGLLLCNFF